MYGTNYVFLQSRGLETNRDLTNRWNSDSGSGFGGVGLLGILYLEVAYNDLTVQLGRFYLPLGYERQIATENTFYSNRYGFTFSLETFQVLGSTRTAAVIKMCFLAATLPAGIMESKRLPARSNSWTAGMRVEWFDDVDGFAVSPTPGPGVYYDLTLGLNDSPFLLDHGTDS